jgi:hypothetical protein
MDMARTTNGQRGATQSLSHGWRLQDKHGGILEVTVVARVRSILISCVVAEYI